MISETPHVELYRRMLLIRRFEELLYELFSKGALHGTTHSCAGQEAVAVGVLEALDRERDVVTSNHRGHGHYLAYTDDAEGLLAELMGRASGICRGFGGSQHLCRGSFYSNGILGSMVPVGVGMAFAEKARKSGAVVCNFLGDGALGEGVVYEAMNMAALWRLPVVFCVENNRYQQATPVEKAVAGDLVLRGRAFGMEALAVDGNDVLGLRDAVLPVVARVREGGGPAWVVCETYRLAGHSKSDDRCYRTREEEALWAARDPIARLAPLLDAAARGGVEEEVRTRLAAAHAQALAAPLARLEATFR